MAEKIGVYIDESSVAPLLSAEELVAFVRRQLAVVEREVAAGVAQ